MVTTKLGHHTSRAVIQARSGLLNSWDDDTYNVIRIPRESFLMSIWLDVSTAYVGGAPSITIGYTYDGTSVTNGIMTNAVSEPLETGVKRAIRETVNSFADGYLCTKPLLITVTVDDGAAATEGIVEVFALYTNIF